MNAITAAGVTYAITRACTNGDLVQCSCDKGGRGRNQGALLAPIPGAPSPSPPTAAEGGGRTLPPGDWQWGGCGDNIRYGYRKSRDFMDARYKKRSDIKTLIKLHNNNAGRLVRLVDIPMITSYWTCVSPGSYILSLYSPINFIFYFITGLYLHLSALVSYFLQMFLARTGLVSYSLPFLRHT